MVQTMGRNRNCVRRNLVRDMNVKCFRVCFWIMPPLLIYSTGHGKLSEAEVERLKKDAAGLFEPDNPARDINLYITRTGTAAIERAMKEKEYSVLEAALNNQYVRYEALFYLREVPIEQKKRLAMIALLDYNYWPDPKEASKPRNGNLQMIQRDEQGLVCQALSSAFGLEVKYPEFWSTEERLVLADRIRRHMAETTPPEELPEWATAPLPSAAYLNAKAQPIEGIPEKTPFNSEAPKTRNRSRFAWVGVIAGLLAGGVWILQRSTSKQA